MPERAVGVALGFATGGMLVGTLNFFLEFPEPCQIVLDECKTNAKAVELFGADVKREILWEGAITSEQASVTIPVYGEKGRGTVYGRLVRNIQDDSWRPVLIVARKGESLVSLKEQRFV